jgi:hypothetical protein
LARYFLPAARQRLTMSCTISRFLIIAQVALASNACAPSGYSYGKWSDGPAAAFTLSPNDDCQRAETRRDIINALNGRVGQPDGPSAPVISADGLVTVPNGAINGPTLTCQGTMQTESGTIGPGVAVLRLAGDSRPNAIFVKDASWETDADREQREILARRARAKRFAQAPAREAKMMEEMRTSAQSNPDKTVHCGISSSSFWTTNAICFALIDEAHRANRKVGKASRVDILHECASDLARKLPGKDQPAYLNSCEQLLSALRI